MVNVSNRKYPEPIEKQSGQLNPQERLNQIQGKVRTNRKAMQESNR